ncbi:dual specificity protein phosphatase 22-A-like isoform X2 [Pleurodeles waltl]|uniref:dual specificity protein phosphatase 22-A-like isoform X2 n=1 Tax=Pleurodeles waltl TaxID=8319 RepID=UPI003709955D
MESPTFYLCTTTLNLDWRSSIAALMRCFSGVLVCIWAFNNGHLTPITTTRSWACPSKNPLTLEMTYLCIAASDSSSQNLIQHFKKCVKFIHDCRLRGGGCLVHCLAGVSRSTTILVAYLMTVTNLGWEDCLSAVRAVRPYVGPNLGFQQQLQEYQMTLYRVWLRQEYGRNPFNDQEQVQRLLAQQNENEEAKNAQNRWLNQSPVHYSLPYKAYGSSGIRWDNR